MATTIKKGFIYLTSGTVNEGNDTIEDGGVTVPIAITQVEHTFNKDLKEFPRPQGGNAGTKSMSNVWIDLKTIKQTVGIVGHLVDEVSSTAKSKKDNLRILIGADNSVFRKGSIRVVWGTGADRQHLIGNIVKMSLMEKARVFVLPEQSPSVSYRGWEIQLQLAVALPGQIDEKG